MKYRGTIPPSQEELATLEQYQQRTAFDDWISRATVPPEHLSGPGIEVDSLEDPVDIAIDTDNRVLEDARTGTFVVVAENWYYTRPTARSDVPDITAVLESYSDEREAEPDTELTEPVQTATNGDQQKSATVTNESSDTSVVVGHVDVDSTDQSSNTTPSQREEFEP